MRFAATAYLLIGALILVGLCGRGVRRYPKPIWPLAFPLMIVVAALWPLSVAAAYLWTDDPGEDERP